MDEPRLEDIRRHKVDLIKNQNEAFVGVRGDGLFDGKGARAGWIASVEDVEQDVRGGYHFSECCFVCTAGGIAGFHF